jgi:hypothetical protein
MAAVAVGRSYVNCVLDMALPTSMPWHSPLSERMGLRYI